MEKPVPCTSLEQLPSNRKWKFTHIESVIFLCGGLYGITYKMCYMVLTI